MNEDRFLELLNNFGFADKYYKICEEFPLQPGGGPTVKGKKEEVMPMFEASGQEVKYNGKYRMYELVLPEINGIAFDASMFFQRSGLEFTFACISGDERCGSNLAVISSNIKSKYEPQFSINPPYPRPAHNGELEKLTKIVSDFVALINGAVKAVGENS